MKNLTITSAQNKVAKMLTAKTLRKNTVVYGWIQEMINGRKEFRPVYTMGSTWKYSSLHDKTSELTDVLKIMGVEFSQGNDAARGGQTGVFVRITTKIEKVKLVATV